jgi:hypothetical protein
MRKAVDLAVSRGCSIIFTLHDALYLEGKCGREHLIRVLRDCMKEAFQFYFKDTKYFETAGKIKLDPYAWSPEYDEDDELNLSGFKVPCSNMYVDERAADEFERFKKYFEPLDADLL